MPRIAGNADKLSSEFAVGRFIRPENTHRANKFAPTAINLTVLGMGLGRALTGTYAFANISRNFSFRTIESLKSSDGNDAIYCFSRTDVQ